MKIILPDNYSEIKVGQYMSLWDMYEKQTDAYKAQRQCIELLAGLEPDSLKNATWESIEQASTNLNWLISEPDPFTLKLPLIRRFELEGKQYGFIPDMSKLTVGEYADLETLCKDGVFDVLNKLCSILFREVTSEKLDKYNIKVYEPDANRDEAMKNLTMDIAVGAVVFFLQHRKGINFHYATLFNKGGSEKGDVIHNKWGWYGIMYQLAQGDILQMDAVQSIYIEQALTFMAYEKDLNLKDKLKI